MVAALRCIATMLFVTLQFSIAGAQTKPLESVTKPEPLQSSSIATSVIKESDQAPSYVIVFDANRTKRLGEVRDFFWLHWQRRQPGQINVLFRSKEGKPTQANYEFGFNDQGIWNIKVTLCRPDEKEPHIFRIYSLQRVATPGPNWGGYYVPLADDAQIPGTDYMLLLKSDGAKRVPL
jgi:hypothetical protein